MYWSLCIDYIKPYKDLSAHFKSFIGIKARDKKKHFSYLPLSVWQFFVSQWLYNKQHTSGDYSYSINPQTPLKHQELNDRNNSTLAPNSAGRAQWFALIVYQTTTDFIHFVYYYSIKVFSFLKKKKKKKCNGVFFITFRQNIKDKKYV